MNKKNLLVISVIVLLAFGIYSYNSGVDLSPKDSLDYLRAWSFSEVSELELPEETVCTPGCGGNINDHECIDPKNLGDGSLKYAHFYICLYFFT